MVDFNLSRGRDHFVAPNGQGFERYGPGKVTVILDNSNGRFNSFNTSSSLYPHVTPGKSVRIAVKNGSAGTDYSLMRGRIGDIQPYNQGNRKMVKIDVVDGQQFLRDRTVKIGYRQNGSSVIVDSLWTTGRWVDLILERADWPEAEWPRTYDLITDHSGNVSPGSTEDFYTQLQYAWFWVRRAAEGISELEDTELGTFLHDRDGNARFFSQYFTLDQIVQLDESQLLRDISTPQPWETLRNRIEVAVNLIDAHNLAGAGLELLWSIGGTGQNAIPVAAESSFVVDANFRYLNFGSVVPTNIAITFDVDSLDTGAGTDLTAQCTVQYSEIGNGATITLLNNSVTDGFIISLALYGDAIYAEFESVASAEDSTSIDVYGTRTFKLESPWMQEPAYAQATADFLLDKLKDPTQYPTIRIEARPDIQFNLDLYVDVIHLASSTLNIDQLYRIGKIDHSWLRPTGQAVLTTLKLEPYFAVGASSEISNLLSPFSIAAETDGVTPPAAGRMLWTLDVGGFWVWASAEGNPAGSLRHYLIDAALFTEIEITSLVGRTIDAGERFEFDYIWIPSAGSTWISGSNLILVEVVIDSEQAVYELFSPGNYNVWQTAIFDLIDYKGGAIDYIRFYRNAAAGVGGDDRRILFDNVFIGR